MHLQNGCSEPFENFLNALNQIREFYYTIYRIFILKTRSQARTKRAGLQMCLDGFVRPMSLRKRLSFVPIHQFTLFSRRPTFAPKTPPRNIVSSNNSDSDHFAALGEREGEVQRFLRNHILLRNMNWAPNHFISQIYIYTAHQFPFS